MRFLTTSLILVSAIMVSHIGASPTSLVEKSTNAASNEGLDFYKRQEAPPTTDSPTIKSSTTDVGPTAPPATKSGSDTSTPVPSVTPPTTESSEKPTGGKDDSKKAIDAQREVVKTQFRKLADEEDKLRKLVSDYIQAEMKQKVPPTGSSANKSPFSSAPPISPAPPAVTPATPASSSAAPKV